VVTDIRLTLEDPDLVSRFRKFLRDDLDRNRNTDPNVKKKNEQWLDFVIICQQVFSLEEDEAEERVMLMVDIADTFLAKPTLGYNMALKSQINRKELIEHCKNLKERVILDPDTSLLREGYDFIFLKLTGLHDIFRKRLRPKTTLHTLICALS